QSVRAFCREFWFQNPLARACPGHPRLEPATISAPKTWMAGPSPATGILLVAQDRGLATVSDSPDSPARAGRGRDPWRIRDAPPGRRTHACAERGGRVRGRSALAALVVISALATAA